MDIHRFVSLVVIAALLLSFSPSNVQAEHGRKPADEESEQEATRNQILAATCVGSGLTMILVSGVMEDKTTHRISYHDVDGYRRDVEFETGSDTTSLFLIGASMILLGTMFMVFPSDRSKESRSVANAMPLTVETKVLAGNASAIGCTWSF